MALLRVIHATIYRHSGQVPASWQLARLRPLRTRAQVCLSFDLDIRPRPTDLAERTDFFGNTQHSFSIREPHTELAVTSTSLVRREAKALSGINDPPSIAHTIETTTAAIADGDPTLEQFRHPTYFTPALAETRSLAVSGESDGCPVLEWMVRLGERFAGEFAFDPTATAVSTPLSVVMRYRRGVCQDFAHAYASCARQHGLATAYVSGYLLTRPPPGQMRLRGADAMHAWVSVFVPGMGWVDYDPTNGCFVDERYVIVARGRDYADVSPIRGFFRGAAGHTLFLGVTVEPADEA